jgi:hypothetical protein
LRRPLALFTLPSGKISHQQIFYIFHQSPTNVNVVLFRKLNMSHTISLKVSI